MSLRSRLFLARAQALPRLLALGFSQPSTVQGGRVGLLIAGGSPRIGFYLRRPGS
jgi:hypothetical protein